MSRCRRKSKRAAAATPPGARSPMQVRARIDAIDEQIQALINERARLAQLVGISKSRDGRTVDFYRPEREAQVLRMARGAQQGPLRDEEVLRLFREIMSACLAQQEPLKVAFLGPEGTFTQAAVLHALRSLGARAAAGLDRRGVPRGRGRQRRLRRGADRELHRRHGQSHARPVPDFAAEDLRRGGAAHPPLPDGHDELARTASSASARIRSRSRSAAAG